MPLEVAQAAERRLERVSDEETDIMLRSLFAHYQSVTADPRKMGYLRSLIKHYAKDAHPWRACYRDNFKRFGPHTNALCGVLKDTIRQSTNWRGHNNPHDVGTPGVAIAEADKGAAPAFGGHHNLKLADVPPEVWAAIEDFASQCEPCRVLLGLDEAPHPSQTFLEHTGVTA